MLPHTSFGSFPTHSRATFDRIALLQLSCHVCLMPASQGIRAKRFYVSGGVQGVGYRFFVRHTAERLGVAGYVKNLPDGRVEVYALAAADQLHLLVQELRRGPTHARVEDVVHEEAESLREFSSGFTILY